MKVFGALLLVLLAGETYGKIQRKQTIREAWTNKELNKQENKDYNKKEKRKQERKEDNKYWNKQDKKYLNKQEKKKVKRQQDNKELNKQQKRKQEKRKQERKQENKFWNKQDKRKQDKKGEIDYYDPGYGSGDTVLCPGKDQQEYCDCDPISDCGTDFCECEDAIACCADAGHDGDKNPPTNSPVEKAPTTAPTNSPVEKAPTTAPTNSPIDLTILHMNDHHSHLEQEDFDLRGDDVPPSLIDVDRLRVHYGGFPRLVSLVKKIEEESTGNVLKFHAGDAITGTSFYSLFKGKADADMMNRICFDAVGLGNHEFDNGDQTLTDFLKVLTSQSDICDSTPVLAANLSPGDNSPLKQLVADGIIMPSMIKTLPGGQKLGVIGINIKRKTEISSNPDEGTNFLDEKETTEAEIQKLKDSGASIIIVITHVGFSNDLDWIAEIDGVDVIIGGDSHTLLGNAQDLAIISEPTSSFPTIVQNGNKKVCVVQAWEYAHGLGKLQISFDENGNVVTCNGGMVFPFDGERFTVKTDPDDYDLTSEQASEVSAYLESLGSHLVATPKDLDTTSKLEEYSSQVDELAQMIIATVPDDICYERIPGQGRSTICTEEDTAAQGGGVCNIASKAFMDQVKTADVAINNAGGCRQDIIAGDFSIEDAYELLPFSNTLVVFDMTGDEIIELLEQSLKYALSPDGSSGAYPYASGLRFDVNATEPFGSRFSDVEVNSRVLGEWTAIDSSNVYAVATNSFIAAGRDGYILFGELSDEGKMLDTYLEYAQTFIDYSIDVGTLVDLPLEEYSTQSYFVSE